MRSATLKSSVTISASPIRSATYGILVGSLKEAKLAKAEREIIEKACEEHIKMIREYRAEMEEMISQYLIDSMDVFRDSFSGIKYALAIGDVDLFIESANTVTKRFGGQVSFSSMDDFNTKMISGATFKI